MLCATGLVVDTTENRKAWRPKCAAPRLGYEQNQKATYYCSSLDHPIEVTFVGVMSERRPKCEPFVFTRLFCIRGPYIYFGRREGGMKRGNKRGGASCKTKIKKYRAVLRSRYQVADGRWREVGR